jgi:squalene cyclase
MCILSSTNTGKKSVELDITNIINRGYSKSSTHSNNIEKYVLCENNYSNIAVNIIYYDKNENSFWVYFKYYDTDGISWLDKINVKSMKHLDMIESYKRNILNMSSCSDTVKLNKMSLEIRYYGI